jgi:hypothetical protein
MTPVPLQTRHTMPPMQFKAEEFKDAAQACRAFAHTCEQDALKHGNPSIVAGFNASARHFRELAQKFELAARWL